MLDLLMAVNEALQYDRQAIADGQLWRLVTGHFVHFGFEHFVWDAAVFVLLAVLCWRLGRGRCLACLAGATLAIPAVLWIVQPGLETYRGLSGLDSALYVTAGLGLGQRLWVDGRRMWATAAFVSVAALAAKVGFELATGQALFVDEAAMGFIPVPLAHAAGGITGALAALLPRPHLSGAGLAVFRERLSRCQRSSGMPPSSSWCWPRPSSSAAVRARRTSRPSRSPC